MTSHIDRTSRAPRHVMLRLLDPVVFLVFVFLAVDSCGLAWLGLHSVTRAVITNVLALAVLTLMVSRMKDRGNRWLAYLSGPVACGLGALLLISLQRRTFEASVEKDFWTGWVVPTWHHAPQNYFPLYGAIWPYAIAFLIAVAAVLYLHATGRRLAFVLFSITLVAGLYKFTQYTVPTDVGFVLMFELPLVVGLLFGWAGQPVIERRFAIFSLFATPALAFYVCLVPLAPTPPPMAGLSRVYPLPGRPPAVSMAHLRDAVIDTNANKLVMSWGSTCGLLDIDLKMGTERIMATDLMRYLSRDRETGNIYGAGFHSGDILEFGGDPLQLLRGKPLHDLHMGELLLARQNGPDLFVAGTDPPMFARLDWKTLEPRALHWFHPLQTRMPLNWGYFDLTPDGSRVYVNMYMTDIDRSGALLELDGPSLEVLRSVALPEPAVVVILDAPRHRLLLSGGESDRLFEVDWDRFEVVGVHKGLLHARFFVYDARRNWIVAGSYYSGEIAFFDGTTFEEVYRARLSRRIQNGFIDDSGQNCYIATSEGLYRLRLDEFAASIGRPSSPVEPPPPAR